MPKIRVQHLITIILIHISSLTVFAFEINTPINLASISFLGANNFQYTGWSLSSGDVDGDGINDLLIGGSPVYLILGKNIGRNTGTTIEDVADASFIAENSGDDFGDAVCMSGDINNDGFHDILIGADRYNASTGKTYLIMGKASGWAMDTGILEIADATFTGEDTNDWSGYALAFAGDINGDGFDDLLVGAYMADVDSLENAGRIYLFLGKASGWQGDLSVAAADARLNSEFQYYGAGRRVVAAGDVNHDGLDDFLISAPGNEVYLFLGKTSGWSGNIGLESADGSFLPENPGDSAGMSIGPAGDVNNDGFDDFLIGAEEDDTGASRGGKAYLVLGRASGWAQDVSLAGADASFYGETEKEHLGDAVSAAGDVNNDGFDDFLIGAPWADQYTGKAYLVHGKENGWSFDTPISATDASFIGEATYDYAGFSMAPAGDINQDGNDDFMISAAYFGSTYTGKVYFWYGDGPVWGDLNGDRMVDLSDVIIGLKVLSSSSQSVVFGPQNDVNGDSRLGLEEVVYDLQRTSGLR